MTVLVLMRDARFALRPRKKSGLLAGLWEFPNFPGHLDGVGLTHAIRELGLEPLRIEALGPAKHVFTHVEWHMQGYRVTVEEERSGGLCWAGESEFQNYALPSAFRYYLPDFIMETLI